MSSVAVAEPGGNARRVPIHVLLRIFLRSLAIQGSWNERTMQGSGFAFALIPGLRALHGRDGPELRRALSRHLEHFNAHPYLGQMALGAILKMEAEGSSAAEIRDFKRALRGPLGGIGDSLVWAGWLPLCALGAILAHHAGASTSSALAGFLLVYNAGHLSLRLVAFRAGLRHGREIGDWLREAQLPRVAGRLASGSVLLLGAVAGVLLEGGIDNARAPLPALLLPALLFILGFRSGGENRSLSWGVFLLIFLLTLAVGVLA